MPVGRALRGLAGTMERRGGIGDARLRAADSALDMKRMDYGLTRQKELDALQRPELKNRADRFAHQNEEIGFNISDLSAKDTMGKIHQWTPGKSGMSLMDEYGVALPGSVWGPKGERLNADGTPTRIARWKWEQEIMPGITMMNISSIDPVKKLNDVVWEKEEFLKDLPKGSEEYNQMLSELNDTKAVLSDNTKMATVYARQGMLVSEYLAKAYANNYHPRLIKFLENKYEYSQKKLNAITVTGKESAELTGAKLKNEKLRAEIDQIKARTEGVGLGKPMTEYQQTQINAKALELAQAEAGLIPPDESAAYIEKRYPEIQKLLQPPTMGLGPMAAPTILTGRDATKEANRYISLIDKGSVNPEQLLQQLLQSGQMEVGRQIVAHLKAKLGAGEVLGGGGPAQKRLSAPTEKPGIEQMGGISTEEVPDVDVPGAAKRALGRVGKRTGSAIKRMSRTVPGAR